MEALEQSEHEAGVKVRHDGGTNSAFRLSDEDEYIPGLAIEVFTQPVDNGDTHHGGPVVGQLDDSVLIYPRP